MKQKKIKQEVKITEAMIKNGAKFYKVSATILRVTAVLFVVCGIPTGVGGIIVGALIGYGLWKLADNYNNLASRIVKFTFKNNKNPYVINNLYCSFKRSGTKFCHCDIEDMDKFNLRSAEFDGSTLKIGYSDYAYLDSVDNIDEIDVLPDEMDKAIKAVDHLNGLIEKWQDVQAIKRAEKKKEKEQLRNQEIELRTACSLVALKIKDDHPIFNRNNYNQWVKENGNTSEPELKNATELANRIKFLYDCIETNNLNVVVFDTETTGVNRDKDYILSMGIIDYNGNVLFDEMFKPGRKKKWDEASDVNGIYYDDVKDKMLISKYQEQIAEILNNADVIIGYNHIYFDLPMLQNESNGIFLDLKKDVIMVDVMNIISPMIGEWSDKYSEYKYVKLTKAYNKFVGGYYKAHGAVADAEATLKVFKNIAK